MTLNDIKIAALQLMFTNYDEDIRNENVDYMTKDEYLQYIVNMDASINRCLGRFETAGVLAPGKLVVDSDDGIVGDYYTKYEMSSLASDYLSIQRVIHENGALYEPAVGYTMQGDTLVLPRLAEGATYTVLYNKRIPNIAIGATSDTNIGVPDNLANLIPYYIKADLYEEDEPQLAKFARNVFEQALTSCIRYDYAGSGGVVNRYGGLQ